MAGDWIKIETTTPDKPEVWGIAEITKLTPDEVLGKLIRLWIYADQQTSDGNAPGVTLALLDCVASCEGFAAAVVSVGWLKPWNVSDTDGEEWYFFPHFERHSGQTAKDRALTQKRVTAHRAKKGNGAGVTGPLPEKRRVREGVNPLPLSMRKQRNYLSVFRRERSDSLGVTGSNTGWKSERSSRPWPSQSN